MAAATALTSAPFIRHHYRRCLFIPTVAASVHSDRLINKHGSIIPSVGKYTPLHPNYPICKGKPTAPTRIRKRAQLLCYCTGAGAQNNNKASSATWEGEEDNAVREVANTLDIRVGRILKAWRHEEADSLYVEEVDVGEPEPRTICSGLVKYVPLDVLQDRSVVVLANLKPRNMRGVKSFGMLMAASDAAHENIELLVPPKGTTPGDRVWFGSVDEKENLPDVASPNQVQKKKIWELVQPHLRTDDYCVARLGSKHQMLTSAGPIISQSLKNANIS